MNIHSKMKFASKLTAVFGFLLIASTGFDASSADFSLIRNKNDFFLKQGNDIVLKVTARKNDEAFLAGRCLVVRRNVRPGELHPEVDRLESLRLNGDRQVYLERDLGIRRINDIRVLTNPTGTWSVVPDEEEGTVAGFFLISSSCSIREVAFSPDGTIHWNAIGGRFTDDDTLLLPSLKLESSNGENKSIKIEIHQNGTYKIIDV
jgi:hypothetical protein